MTRFYSSLSMVTLLVFAGAVTLGGCGPITMTIGNNAASQPLQESVVEHSGLSHSRSVAIIDIAGMIYTHSPRGLLSIEENPASLLHERLEMAASDRAVAAILLRLNTPGGTVTASDVLYRQVMRFKARTGKPVIALMMDVAASGGYYVACAADHIVAHPTTVTGSIGVILQTVSVKRALDRWGVDAVAFTSGPNKDAGSPWSTMSEEHRGVLSGMVDDFYQRFADLVRRSRPQIPDAIFEQVTDGRILSGIDALHAGLVDELGDLHDAFAKAREMAGIEHAHLVIYHRPLSPARSPYAAAAYQPPHTQINLAQINLDASTGPVSAGFFYLWRPEQGMFSPR